MYAALLALVSLFALLSPLAARAELSHDEAVAALADGDPQRRAIGAARLADVGTMADAKALVRALKDRDAATRAHAEQALWRVWSRSGDAEIDRQFDEGLKQMTNGDIDEAIATYSRIIERRPDFAEAWNKRATVYFVAGQLAKSAADCDEVIKRNPDHFGALSGYAQIELKRGRYERALGFAKRALAVNPNIQGLSGTIRALEHAIEQSRGPSA